MPLYEDRTNAENRIKVKAETKNSIVVGNTNIVKKILKTIEENKSQSGKPVKIAIDAWYGVDWDIIVGLFKQAEALKGLTFSYECFTNVFKSKDEINNYKKTFVTDDPGFGWSNTEGAITDIIDFKKLEVLKDEIAEKSNADAIIIYGYGAAISEFKNQVDIRYYADMTQQQLLWKMWDGNLVPFGQDTFQKEYFWKEYYYCDFYLLHHHKPYAFANMDYYFDVTDVEEVKIMPKSAFDDIVATMAKYPVKEVKIFQPGPWGAYRYKDLFNVDGLKNNAWNELAGPELNILIDIEEDYLINMPVTNLLEQGENFVGKYIHENLPGMIPYDVWLNDGYFPEPVPQERSSMPIHNHPSTDYIKRHFNEPLGRYETYYIAEAHKGANTIMGVKDDVDLELWEKKCRESWEKQEPIPDWKDFMNIWPTNVGDLFLIPPGTTHGQGANQMILEMDTSASPCGTEYSFFTYDYMRNSWDDNTKTMTGKPMKMHLEHGFNNEKWRDEKWVNKHLRLRQSEVVRWDKECSLDRYEMVKEMPFQIERLHFREKGKHDTEGKFMHIPTLTVGKRVKIRSINNPELEAEINQWQACLIPASFGEYECINMGEGACTLVYIRWNKG